MIRADRVVAPSFEGLAFVGYRFPPEVILLAVHRYLRCGLSYRYAEELLAERGIDVDHVTLYRGTVALSQSVSRRTLRLAPRAVWTAKGHHAEPCGVARLRPAWHPKIVAAPSTQQCPQDRPGSLDRDPGSRLHPEPTPRPLRTRRGGRTPPANRSSLHRTRQHHLDRTSRPCRSALARSNNATAPPAVVTRGHLGVPALRGLVCGAGHGFLDRRRRGRPGRLRGLRRRRSGLDRGACRP